ncbi:MAG: leucyl aminopeptidase [Planctomycetota bacterium]|jgi:leucyl aminopeptidase|nr:leucyl aminopeptidase [Planctomycetota bacterium]
MRLTLGSPSALKQKAPLVVLMVSDGKASFPAGDLHQQASKLLKSKTFKGKAAETLVLHATSAAGPRALLLIGMGKAKEITSDLVRRAGLIAGAEGAKLGAKKVVLGAVGAWSLDAASLSALGEGLVLSSYRYTVKKPDTKAPSEAVIISGMKGAAAVLKTAKAVSEGTNLARELGDLPGNIADPDHLRSTARKVCTAGKLRFKSYDNAALKRMKMGGILAVNQGSDKPAYLIEMEYAPARYKHTICIVGKGLTFDAGGISLKPASGMEEMKYDMCGGAATIGLMKAIAATKPKGVRVIGIVGTTENLQNGSAYKPGDVVTTGSGKTIEVINTDAEGRVVLADAIHLATKFKPEAIIDMATLTGAIVVALGHEAAGLFSKDDKLVERLQKASKNTDEKLWHMPSYPAYDEKVKSKWADIRNSAGREAGSCTAAAFLYNFSGGIPHAHLDVAGAAWEMASRNNFPGGASGFGVRLLHNALCNW